MTRTRQLAVAYYDLAILLDAGVPLLRAMQILIQGRTGLFKRVFTRLREKLSDGAPFADAMQQQRVFDDLDVMLIRAAETSGSLGESFKMLSDWYHFVGKIQARILAGMLLPLIILHVAAFLLPIPTAVLSGDFAGYFRGVGSVLAIFWSAVLMVYVVFFILPRIPFFRFVTDAIKLTIPILGQAIREMSICRYCKAFNMLYKAGVPMSECTVKATGVTGNAVIEGWFAGAAESVRSGELAHRGFSRRVPLEYLHIWEVGEETGDLDKTVDKIIEIAADRADMYYMAFAFWFPRIVYFVVIGLLAVAVVVGYMQLYGRALSGL